MLERGQGVLRPQRRAAAVRDNLHAWLLVAEERMAGLRAAAPGAREQQDYCADSSGQSGCAAAFFFAMISAEYFFR